MISTQIHPGLKPLTDQEVMFTVYGQPGKVFRGVLNGFEVGRPGHGLLAWIRTEKGIVSVPADRVKPA